MASGFSLLDLMTAPPLMRRILRALLRHPVLVEDQLWTEVTRGRDDMVTDRAALHGALQDLSQRGWLSQHPHGDHMAYSVRLHYSDRPPSEARIAASDVLDQVDGSQRYHVELAALNVPEAPASSARTPDMLDGLMQRGGKRTLPKNIWDKLGADASDEPATSPPPSSTSKRAGKDLLDLF